MRIWDKEGNPKDVEAVDAVEMVKFNGYQFEDPTGQEVEDRTEIARKLMVMSDSERRLATQMAWAAAGRLADASRARARAQTGPGPAVGGTQADRDEQAVIAQRQVVAGLQAQVRSGVTALAVDLEDAEEALKEMQKRAKDSRAKQDERDEAAKQGGAQPAAPEAPKFGAAATEEQLRMHGGTRAAGTIGGDEFDNMTVADLKKYLDQEDVEYAANARKADLVELAKNARDGG